MTKVTSTWENGQKQTPNDKGMPSGLQQKMMSVQSIVATAHSA